MAALGVLGVALGWLALALLMRWARWRWMRPRVTGVDYEGMRVELTGPPVPDEFHLIFSPYGGGKRVTGLAVLPDGISVGFEAGPTVLFVPVIAGDR